MTTQNTKSEARAANADPALKHVPTLPERNMTSDRHDITPPRHPDPSRVLPGSTAVDERPHVSRRDLPCRGREGIVAESEAAVNYPAFIPGVIPWMLFTAAGLAFAWGGSGIAVSLAEYRGRRWGARP